MRPVPSKFLVQGSEVAFEHQGGRIARQVATCVGHCLNFNRLRVGQQSIPYHRTSHSRRRQPARARVIPRRLVVGKHLMRDAIRATQSHSEPLKAIKAIKAST